VRAVSFWWNAARLENVHLPRSLGVVCTPITTRDAVAGYGKKDVGRAERRGRELFCRPAGNRPGFAAGHSIASEPSVIGKTRTPSSAHSTGGEPAKIRLVFLGIGWSHDPYVHEFSTCCGMRRGVSTMALWIARS